MKYLMQQRCCFNSSSDFPLYQIPELIFLKLAFSHLFFSSPLTLPLNYMILPQQFLPLPTFLTHIVSLKVFSKS